MTFKIDSWNKKQLKLQEWHTWFAWYPVRISEDEVVWLEKVQRKQFYFSEIFIYKKNSVDKATS